MTLGDTLKKNISRIWDFHGGLRVPSRKSRTHNRPISTARLPEKLILPLSQHIGRAAVPVVNIGDKVLKGQVIAELEGHVSAKVHASSSGTVVDIANYPLPHPSGLLSECIIIKTDGLDQWLPLKGAKYPEQLTPSEIRTYIENAGIVGLGGAVFPSAVKMDIPPGRKIHTLIINGAECEPYISCDDALMQERAEEIVLGARLAQKALSADRCIIALEDDVPEAYAALNRVVKNYSDNLVQVVQIPEKYPSGSEKQLIKLLTNLEVPQHNVPSKIGIVCTNVGTATAIYRSIYLGEPLISRIITITGDAVAKPGNVEALFGTPLIELLMDAEIDCDRLERLIMGGPMMGFTLKNTLVPLIKSSNCILAAAYGELDIAPPAMPCIRCSRCADACPMNLLPQQMYWYAKDRNLEKTMDYNIFDCIECGCCSYVCPSNIPLVQYFRYAKTEIHNDQKDRQKAEIARQRHEFRELRLKRIKEEKAARAAARKKLLTEKEKQKKAAEKQAKKTENHDKDGNNTVVDDPIKAAMKRVEEKKKRLAAEKQQMQQKQADKIHPDDKKKTP